MSYQYHFLLDLQNVMFTIVQNGELSVSLTDIGIRKLTQCTNLNSSKRPGALIREGRLFFQTNEKGGVH